MTGSEPEGEPQGRYAQRPADRRPRMLGQFGAEQALRRPQARPPP